MTSKKTILDACTRQIDQWMSEGRIISSMTAGQLHLATGEPYSQCADVLQQFLNLAPKTEQASEAIEDFGQRVQSLQRQALTQLVKLHEQEKQRAVAEAKAGLQQELQQKLEQLQQLADERFEVITQLETQATALTAEKKALKQEAERLAAEKAKIKAVPTPKPASAPSFPPPRHLVEPQPKPALKAKLSAGDAATSPAWAVELSNEQAKEIAALSQQLDASQREYLRVSALYQETKKQNELLEKKLKARGRG